MTCREGPQSWNDKVIPETPVRTYVLPQKMLDAGITISSITSVVPTVWKFNDPSFPDPNPGNILSGTNQKNSAAFTTDDGVAVGINQAVFVQFAANGVAGCTYVIRLTLVLSTGETFAEDVMQKITDYVPASC